MTQRSALRVVFLVAILVFTISSVVTYFESLNRDRGLREMEQEIKRIEQRIDSAKQQLDADRKAAKKAGE